jgi:hypothetical protein
MNRAATASEGTAGLLPLHADPLPLRVDEGGVVRVGTSRVGLDLVVEQYENGMTPEDMVRASDTLVLTDVRRDILRDWRRRLNRLPFGLIGALLWLGFPAGPPSATAGEPAATVTGIVQVEGDPPAPREWQLDDAMQRVTGEKVYREETWLVGKNKGLANCVVTLRPKKPADQVAPKPLRKAVLDKVGVRYVPRVLVVTPGTQVVFRNKESPCRGFQVASARRPDHNFNCLVLEGTEQTVTLRAPDTCPVTCPVRPYAQGYLLVVDTPYLAVTDTAGRFAIRGVPAGEYRVTVWHEAAGRLTGDAGPAEVTVSGEGDVTLKYRVKPPGAGKK